MIRGSNLQNAFSGGVHSTNDDHSCLCATIEYTRFADITSRRIGINLDPLAFVGLRDVAARPGAAALFAIFR